MDFWEWLSNFGNSIGIITCVASSYAAFRLWNQNRALREFVRQTPPVEGFVDNIKINEGIRSVKPLALAVSLTPQSNSIKSSVDTFLDFKDWKRKVDVEELVMKGINGAEDIERYINLLKQKRSFIEKAGYTDVHLFFSGPVQAGVLAGAFFDNWIPVKLYHKPNPAPPQIYEYWTPLLKG